MNRIFLNHGYCCAGSLPSPSAYPVHSVIPSKSPFLPTAELRYDCQRAGGDQERRKLQKGLKGMSTTNLLTEQQLCLILARKCLSPELAARADFLIRSGLDWDKVLDFSSKHRVFPLVFRHLRRFEPGLVPGRILKLFRVLCLASSRKSEMFAKELARIVKALGKAGIPAVPFKGPLLARLVWGDHRLWVGQDLDILVPRADLRRAEKVLWADGYRTVIDAEEERTPHSLLRNRGKPWVMLAKHDASIRTVVELHTSLFPWWLCGTPLMSKCGTLHAPAISLALRGFCYLHRGTSFSCHYTPISICSCS